MKQDRKQKPEDAQDFAEWKKTKGERREEKKAKKMPVHSSGLFEVWQAKIKKQEKTPEKKEDTDQRR